MIQARGHKMLGHDTPNLGTCSRAIRTRFLCIWSGDARGPFYLPVTQDDSVKDLVVRPDWN